MKRIRIDTNILIHESRKLFKSLENKIIYLEVDTNTNSIIYTSGIEKTNTIFMMIEDVFTEDGLKEYENGLIYISENPINIYESYLGSPIFTLLNQVVYEFWVVSLQPSKIVQVICNKTDIWRGLEKEIVTIIDLPSAIFHNNEITACNEFFITYTSNFEDIEFLLLHMIEEQTSLNIIQDLSGKLIPILTRRTKDDKYLFILLVESSIVSCINSPTPNSDLSTEFTKEHFSSLVRMEVELKQMEVRIKQLEQFAFIERNGIASRLKEIEIYQDQDNQKWVSLEIYKETLEDKTASLVFFNTLARNFPGGIKGFIVFITVIIFLFLTIIDIGIRRYGIHDTLNNIDQGVDLIQ